MTSVDSDQQPTGAGPWFRGKPFKLGHTRVCGVCGQKIFAGETGIANFQRKQVAHLGCGSVEPRKEPKR